MYEDRNWLTNIDYEKLIKYQAIEVRNQLEMIEQTKSVSQEKTPKIKTKPYQTERRIHLKIGKK